jgi:hypothetical protein
MAMDARRTFFVGIFIVSLPGDRSDLATAADRERLVKPGIPVRRRILLLTIQKWKEVLRVGEMQAAKGVDGLRFIMV